MTKRRLGQTDIAIEPLVLGTNVIGWTTDEPTSFAVLDAFVAEGFSALDTADSYSRWVPGNDSESERTIGRWMKARGNRDKVHVFTKVGSDMGQGHRDLSAQWIEQAVEGSLQRLQTDYIDLYQSHWPDPATPIEETLEAHDRLVRAGKVRFIGTSNQTAPMLAEALAVSDAKGLARYQSVQNEFNLYSRAAYQGELEAMMLREGLSLLSYYSLAAGFLTGKYRSEADFGQSPRGRNMGRYLNDKGLRILAALDAVAERLGASAAEVAIAWIVAHRGVAGAIASATSIGQLESLARGARLDLDPADFAMLTAAGQEG